MNEIYGWTGKLLLIDLTKKSIKTESSEKYFDFIGGRGVQQWILFNEVSTETSAYDSENLLIFGTGPLTGTEAPASNFLAISSKNAYNKGTNFSYVGGHFAPELKFAGYDHIIVKGASDTPVYLWISDDTVELRDASQLWGKTIDQTEATIRSTHNDEDIRVASIGPAGEHLVRFAAIMVDKTRAAGGGGIGAVMGSKKLKAIAVRGTGDVKIADEKAFNQAVEKAMEKINASQNIGMPTHVITKYMNNACLMPVKNTYDDHWDEEKLHIIDLPQIAHYKSKEMVEACYNCPFRCGNYLYEVNEGPYAGLKSRLFEAGTAYSMGSRLGITDFGGILNAFEQVNNLGMDESNSGVVISWAFDCYNRGLLTKDDTDGDELKWGDHLMLNKLIKKIAYREGKLGNLLAEGVMRAAKKVGKGSDYYGTHVKNQDFSDAVRGAKGWALGIMTATRAGRHTNGAPASEFQRLPPEVGKAVFGIETAGDGKSYQDKAKLVHWHEKFKAVVDIVGMCYSTSVWADPTLLLPDDYAAMFSAAVGKTFSGDDLMTIGKKIHNIEKAINTIHAGFVRDDDNPPKILTKEPIKSGIMKGELLGEKEWAKMLDEYYEENGWDIVSSWQKKDVLIELGLDTVAKALEDKNLLKN